MGEEAVLPWLKSLPLAPEFHPSLSEFQDPISYIFKIEQIASKYGICKIIPPFSPASKKTVISNLNKSLLAKNSNNENQQQGTFTTRQQQVGFCVRKSSNRPVQKAVWQSGEVYTLSHFETKAKGFEKGYLKNKGKRVLSELEIESLYWKAQVDKPITVEYANDMPGSAFEPFSGTGGRSGKGKRKEGEGVTVGETEWNMRGVSRSKGSLLKFMKEEIPGVTSPMVYISMLFSWFAWHVEDHDFHSLNYMHMAAGKTWYGVPRDAAVAFEDVVRVHGYGGEINPIELWWRLLVRFGLTKYKSTSHVLKTLMILCWFIVFVELWWTLLMWFGWEKNKACITLAARYELRNRRRQVAATNLEAKWFSHKEHTRYKKLTKATVTTQSGWRARVARRELRRLKMCQHFLRSLCKELTLCLRGCGEAQVENNSE